MENFTNKLPPLVKQTWTSCPVFINKFCLGMGIAFTSCLLTEINDPASDLKMDKETTSWIVVSLGLSLNLGYVMSSCLMPPFGRRTASLVASVPGIVGFAIHLFTIGPTSLIVVRILLGFSVGAYGIMAGVIIGEYTSPRNRAIFLSLTNFIMNVGSLVVHLLGIFINWKTLAILIPSPYIIAFIICFTNPESPAWLAQKKRYEKSRQVFYWLRGRTEETTREIEALIRAQNNRRIDKTLVETAKDFLTKFKKYNFLMPMFIMTLLAILNEVCGRHYFSSYAMQLVQQVMPNTYSNFSCTITIDVLIVVSNLLSTYLITIMKTRTLLFASSYGTIFTLLLACLALFLGRTGILPGYLSPAPVIFLTLSLFAANLGCTNIPILLGGEIIPLEHKVIGGLYSYIVFAGSLTVILKILPLMVEACYIEGAFTILAVWMLLIVIILHFILPETKDRTLQDIEEHFKRNRARDDKEEEAGKSLRDGV